MTGTPRELLKRLFEYIGEQAKDADPRAFQLSASTVFQCHPHAIAWLARSRVRYPARGRPRLDASGEAKPSVDGQRDPERQNGALEVRSRFLTRRRVDRRPNPAHDESERGRIAGREFKPDAGNHRGAAVLDSITALRVQSDQSTEGIEEGLQWRTCAEAAGEAECRHVLTDSRAPPWT